jgi:hypothetical protein
MAAVALTRHSLANGISDAKSERTTDQNRGMINLSFRPRYGSCRADVMPSTSVFCINKDTGSPVPFSLVGRHNGNMLTANSNGIYGHFTSDDEAGPFQWGSSC